jgi:murein DD-endopeptidase MepM/ murein hydrolase activator NlpD
MNLRFDGYRFLVFITLAAAAACSGVSVNTTPPASQPAAAGAVPAEPQLSTPTAVLPGGETVNIPLETLAPQQAHDDSPLRFTFPTPQPPPTSLWRPPLYDVPWALSPFDHFYFTRPIAANEVNWPLADYRYGGILFGKENIHTGIDIPAPRGTPVLAAGPGEVMFAGNGLYRGADDPTDPYGNAVLIRHDFGYQGRHLFTIYAHMDRIDVIPGQRAETGTQLGIVGTTGNTTGPHLHFEVRLETNSFFATRNPELWLAPPQGWGVLVGRMMNSNHSLLSRQAMTVRSLKNGQKWTVFSYGDQAVNLDEHYQENVVLSDLPAGDYEVTIDYLEDSLKAELSIHPGAVTYFTFRGKYGFTIQAPPGSYTNDWLKVVN